MKELRLRHVSLISLLMLLASLSYVHADDERFPFESTELESRFDHLTEELRCLVCQNQSLADSDAPLANDLRREVYKMISAGQSDEQILEFLVARYGEFVLYRPRLNSATYLLWGAPLLLVGCGLIAIIILMRRKAVGSDQNEADLAKDLATLRKRLGATDKTHVDQQGDQS